MRNQGPEVRMPFGSCYRDPARVWYSTGDYAQYLVIIHKGKEFVEEYMLIDNVALVSSDSV